jgi:P27 family predicted phage terminase small subunit
LPVPHARRRNRRRSGPHTPGNSIAVARPSLPRTLAGEARAEWNRVVPELEEMGVIASVDRALLIRYCRAWGEWCELDALLDQSGKLIRGQKGNLVRNPIWLLRRDAEETVTELARQLGLSPMARLRAGVAHVRPPDPGEEERRIAVIDEYRRRLEPDPREILRST